MRLRHSSCCQQVIRVAIFLAFTAAYCLSQSQSEPRVALALVVAPSAGNVSYASSAGQTELTYTVQEPYPAEHTLRFIEETLRSRNWKPLKKDAAANARSSHESEWTDHESATCLVTRTVHQWVGEWQDDEHNLVRYTLLYVVKETDSQDSDSQREDAPASLQVYAVYVPASVARSIMRPRSH